MLFLNRLLCICGLGSSRVTVPLLRCVYSQYHDALKMFATRLRSFLPGCGAILLPIDHNSDLRLHL